MYRLLSVRLDDDDNYEACYGQVEADDEDRFDYTVGERIFHVVGRPGEPVNIPTEVEAKSDFEYILEGTMPDVAQSIMFEKKVDKWGNSLAVRLPYEIVRQMGLEKGDKVAMHIVNSAIVILPVKEGK